jgi:hypothetical protein
MQFRAGLGVIGLLTALLRENISAPSIIVYRGPGLARGNALEDH